MNGVIEAVINSYLNEAVMDVSRLSGGHINGSFLVTGQHRYVLQCLNKSLYEAHLDTLLSNYKSYRAACIRFKKDKTLPGSWDYPRWFRDRDGESFHRASEGGLWRMYKYMPSDDLKKDGNTDTYEIGKGLGRLHYILGMTSGIRAVKTTARLHDLSYFYEEYIKQKDSPKERDAEIDKEIETGYDFFSSIRVPGGNIIHGDAKIGNMIVRDGKVTGFIDLDTLMEGSRFDDIADCARSCCLDGSGEIDVPALVKLLDGYEAGADVIFTKDARELAAKNMVKNRFMLGMRYYTDYLADGGYFREEYPGRNLEKARGLFEPFIRASLELQLK